MYCLSCSVALVFFNLEKSTSLAFYKTVLQDSESSAWLFGTISHNLVLSAYFLMIRFKLIHFARVSRRQHFVLSVASHQEPQMFVPLLVVLSLIPCLNRYPPDFSITVISLFPFCN